MDFGFQEPHKRRNSGNFIFRGTDSYDFQAHELLPENNQEYDHWSRGEEGASTADEPVMISNPFYNPLTPSTPSTPLPENEGRRYSSQPASSEELILPPPREFPAESVTTEELKTPETPTLEDMILPPIQEEEISSLPPPPLPSISEKTELRLKKTNTGTASPIIYQTRLKKRLLIQPPPIPAGESRQNYFPSPNLGGIINMEDSNSVLKKRKRIVEENETFEYEIKKPKKRRRISRVKKYSTETEEKLIAQSHLVVRTLMNSKIEYFEQKKDSEGTLTARFIQGKGNGNFSLKKIQNSKTVGIILKPSRTKWWKSYVLRVSGLQGDINDWSLNWDIIDVKYPSHEWMSLQEKNGETSQKFTKIGKNCDCSVVHRNKTEEDTETPFLKVSSRDKNLGLSRFNLKFHYIIKQITPTVTKDSIMLMNMLSLKNEKLKLAYFFPFIGTTYEDGGKDYKNEFKKVKKFPLLVYRK